MDVMVFGTLTSVIAIICLVSAVIHVISEWRKWTAIRAITKLAAITAFIALAVVNGAADSQFGRLILLALVLSWIGDALLLSLRSAFLLGGITAFFLAHGFFAVALASQPLDTKWLTVAFLILGCGGLLILRWLWKYLEPFYKIAVPVYLAAITVMASLAIAASFASASPLLGIAAMAFAASDVSVARDRFIGKSLVNKAWSLPLYYAAQVLFAMSVLSFR